MKTGLFKQIREQAEILHGGREQISSLMPEPKSAMSLRRRTDSWYLSLMSRRIFRAGLKHAMVDAKWPAFEQVFSDFDINHARMLSDDDLEALMNNRNIIRHWGKLKSIRTNANAISDLQDQYKGMGDYLAAWPVMEITGLWEDLIKRFTHLGGNSGPYFLRMAGKDTFLLTRDVVTALNYWGVFGGEPKGRSDRTRIQNIFNQWHMESGRPLCEISMTLALSTD